jgi:hypothetical protein
MMEEEQAKGLNIEVASVLPRDVGDYWKGVSDERKANGGPQFVWYVRARTGTFIRHCELDAAASAQNAIKELVKYEQEQKVTFQRQVEDLMENMLAYYEDLHYIAEEISTWADDYVSMTE